MEDFDVWSGRKLEQQKFARWSDEKKAAANGDLDSIGKLYGLHPGIGEVDQKAKESAAAKGISSEREPQPQVKAPFTPVGQSARQGETNAPTKPFTFSQSPKAEIPANRFSAFDNTLLPGFEARTGMPFIPPSVGTSYDNPLEATPFGAYTNIWNIEEADPSVPSVFADMDDETLSQLITEYSDHMKKLKSVRPQEPSEKSYGERTLDQLVLGNYSNDATLLGTAAQVGMGLVNLDLPMDIRDLTYDLTNWEWSPEHIAQTLLDAVGFIPVIGSLKYADELSDLLKSADEVADLARKAPELVELAREMGKIAANSDEAADFLKATQWTDLLRNTDETIDLLGSAGEFTEGAGDGLKYFDDIQLRTEPNKAYFWSGLGETGADTAASIAKKNGGMTLETIIEKQGIKMPKFDITNSNAVEARQKSSKAYAKQASGEVRAIVSSNLRPTSIWNTVELPALKANPKVSKIIVIDPETLVETVIFSR